jgi:hypothetical protein
MFPETIIVNIHLHGSIIYQQNNDDALNLNFIVLTPDDCINNLVVVNATAIGQSNFESHPGGKWMDRVIQRKSEYLIDFNHSNVMKLLRETIPRIKKYKIKQVKRYFAMRNYLRCMYKLEYMNYFYKTDKWFGIQYIQTGGVILNRVFSTGRRSYCTVGFPGGKPVDLLQKMDVPFDYDIDLRTILIFLQQNGAKNILLFDHSCSCLKISIPRQISPPLKTDSPSKNVPSFHSGTCERKLYYLRRNVTIKSIMDNRTIRRLSNQIEKEMKIIYV